LLSVTLALVFLLSFSQAALSHAILLEAVPAVDLTVTGPNISVKLRFNVRIDRGRSRLALVLPDGKTTSLKIDEETTPDSLSAQAIGLARGAYRLRWQVLASDGHITRGEVAFQISGP
jgi:methionine-rich copper-binding protein CopC